MNEDMPKHLKTIFTEMCKRVKADPTKINPKKEEWFRKHSWTLEEQDDFAEWMTNYIYNNKEAMKEILIYTTRSKKKVREAVDWFLFNYGWRLK
jgi:GR25 family glycosyltransferase involved in LPS biosynthesis